MSADQERWRPVPGHEGVYEISDFGRCRGLDRVIQVTRGESTFSRFQQGGVMAPHRTNYGHLFVTLGGKTRYFHEMVLGAFVGPRPPGMEARHLDGDESNNRLGNLVWDTHGNNIRDRKWHRGASNQKLTAQMVAEIKRCRTTSGAVLAERYGVNPATISKIRYGEFHIDVDATDHFE